MKISIRTLRKIIREELMREIGPGQSGVPQAQTAPQDAAPQTQRSPQAPQQSNDQKAWAIGQILTKKGEIADTAEIQAWLKKQNPATLQSTPIDQLADEFFDSGNVGLVGTPQMGSGDYDQQQKIKAKNQSLFDKYSSPRN